MGGLNGADLDAVTLDGFGTVLDLVDPIPKLAALLPGRETGEIQRAFRAEAEYYRTHSHEAGDGRSLTRFRADCTAVFNDALGSELTSEEYNGVFVFEVLPGVRGALRLLRSLGLTLAVVANWDLSLHDHLRRHGLRAWLDAVVTSADAGVRKPDPRPFLLAIEALGVAPERTLHVGDDPRDDAEGARAAGLHFAPAPLAEVVARWR